MNFLCWGPTDDSAAVGKRNATLVSSPGAPEEARVSALEALAEGLQSLPTQLRPSLGTQQSWNARARAASSGRPGARLGAPEVPEPT